MPTTAVVSDLEILRRLNTDDVNSVQHGDVRRFDEILAGDFLCTSADGRSGASRYTTSGTAATVNGAPSPSKSPAINEPSAVSRQPSEERRAPPRSGLKERHPLMADG
jgi:hypothetical protein